MALDGGLVPVPGQEQGVFVVNREDWMELERAEQKLLNGLKLHTNMEIMREDDFSSSSTVFRWRYRTPVITTLDLS